MQHHSSVATHRFVWDKKVLHVHLGLDMCETTMEDMKWMRRATQLNTHVNMFPKNVANNGLTEESEEKVHFYYTVLLTKTTATQNELALSYDIVRELYFLGIVFAAIIVYACFIVHYPPSL